MRGKVISYVAFIVCLYFLVFNFPLTPLGFSFGTKNLLYLFLLVIIVFNSRKYTDLVKCFKTEFILLLLPFFYVLFRTMLDGESEFITRHILGILDNFLVPLALVLFAIKAGITTEKQFIRSILILGAIASVISFVSFLFPPVHNYIKFNILNVQPENFMYWDDYRGFGLAMSLTSSYAYIQAIIFVLGCFHSKDNKWFLFFLPLVFLSVILNARTGLLILLVGMVIFLVSMRSGTTSLIFGIIAIIMLFFMDDIMQLFGASYETREWVAVLFNDIDTIYSTRDVTQTGTGSRLFGDMWIMPNTSTEWMIGKGYSLFRHETEVSSDNGWVLQLNYGGIIYMFLLYLIIIQNSIRLCKYMRKTWFCYFLLIFLIVNTKSSFFPGNEVFRFLMTIYMFYIVFDIKYINLIHPKTYEKSFLRSY